MEPGDAVQLMLWPESALATERGEPAPLPDPPRPPDPPRTVYRTLYTLVLALFFTAWLEQDAIALYWRQTHHADAPVSALKTIPAWASGAQANALFARLDAARIDGMAQFDAWAVSAFNGPEERRPRPENPFADRAAGIAGSDPPEPHWAGPPALDTPPPREEPRTRADETARFDGHAAEFLPPPLARAVPLPDRAETPDETAKASVPAPPGERKTPPPGARAVPLDKTDRVLFVGDSLMQGVAPHVNSSLFRRYAIRGLDLSRQSTGLSYPGFFDWPEQIKKAFLETEDIKLLVVFLGPNDPWDLPAARGAHALRFRSEKWENTYRARIREILETARENGARVLWLAPPCMREKELSQKMAYLSELFSDEVGKLHEFFLPTDTLVGCDGVRFESYMSSDGKKVRSRFEDGVHFTLAGQKKIAEAILSFIRFTPAAVKRETRETAP